mgnify:CR=1 FL=1
MSDPGLLGRLPFAQSGSFNGANSGGDGAGVQLEEAKEIAPAAGAHPSQWRRHGARATPPVEGLLQIREEAGAAGSCDKGAVRVETQEDPFSPLFTHISDHSREEGEDYILVLVGVDEHLHLPDRGTGTPPSADKPANGCSADANPGVLAGGEGKPLLKGRLQGPRVVVLAQPVPRPGLVRVDAAIQGGQGHYVCWQRVARGAHLTGEFLWAARTISRK